MEVYEISFTVAHSNSHCLMIYLYCPVDTSKALLSHCRLVDSEGPALYSTKEASIAAHSEFSRDNSVEQGDQAGTFYQCGLGD